MVLPHKSPISVQLMFFAMNFVVNIVSWGCAVCVLSIGLYWFVLWPGLGHLSVWFPGVSSFLILLDVYRSLSKYLGWNLSLVLKPQFYFVGWFGGSDVRMYTSAFLWCHSGRIHTLMFPGVHVSFSHRVSNRCMLSFQLSSLGCLAICCSNECLCGHVFEAVEFSRNWPVMQKAYVIMIFKDRTSSGHCPV